MGLVLYFLLFIIYAFLGWISEIVYVYIKDRRIVNRGFLIGPYCPIYGVGGILVILLLQKYFTSPIVLFTMSVIIFSILEYMTSVIMEKLFKARWWDYSDKKYNINGRICLETLIPFGLLGLFVMYVLNPLITRVLVLIPEVYVNILTVVILVLFILDIVFTVVAVSSIKINQAIRNIENTEEITGQIKIFLSSISKHGKRLVRVFPSMKIYKKIKNRRSKK